MLRLLGYSPEAGRESVDQCEAFKHTLWSRIGRNPTPHAFLKSLYNADGQRGIAVEYDSGVPEAVAYADAAEKEAPHAWETVKHNLLVRARVR